MLKIFLKFRFRHKTINHSIVSIPLKISLYLIRSQDQADLRVDSAQDLTKLDSVHHRNHIIRNHHLIELRIFLNLVDENSRMLVQINAVTASSRRSLHFPQPLIRRYNRNPRDGFKALASVLIFLLIALWICLILWNIQLKTRSLILLTLHLDPSVH